MWEYSIYLGNESDSIHVDFVSTDNLFVVASIENSIEKEAFKGLFEKVRDAVAAERVHNLAAFEKVIDREFKIVEKNPGFALAASLSVENVLYLVTRGNGTVYIDRGPIFQNLVSGDNTASGFLQENDVIALTTGSFMNRITPPTLQRFIQGKTPQEIVEAVTPDLKGNDDTGLIALFSRHHVREAAEETMEEREAEEELEYQVIPPPSEAPMYATPTQHVVAEKPQPNFSLKSLLAGIRPGSSMGKKVTFALLIILVGIFVWSVVLGAQRRQKNTFIKKVEAQSLLIDSQLEEASSLTTTDVDRSLELLASAKQSYEALNKEAVEKKLSDLDQLASIKVKIAESEKSIKKEEETASEEFYDLNLIEKGAEAKKMYYDGTTLALLDSENAKVYLLDLAKKSVVTRKDGKMADGVFVALHQDEPYIFSSTDGVFRTTKEKTDVLIEKDEEWGSIKDMWMYNGNIYLVDAGKDEIYKYLVAEGGYSAKNSYVKSGQADLAKAGAMAIDRSVYVINGSRILKYESGSSVDFTVKIPGGDDIVFDDIYTSEDIDNVYLLDKESKKIFVVSKEGEFLKQVTASTIASTTDFVVDQTEGILLLVKDKIVKIVE